MNPGKVAALRLAEKHHCTLEVAYTRTGGFDLLLWAPSGQAFVSSDARCTADLAGQGCLRDEMDWSKTILSIQKEIAAGFTPADDDDEGEE